MSHFKENQKPTLTRREVLKLMLGSLFLGGTAVYPRAAWASSEDTEKAELAAKYKFEQYLGNSRQLGVEIHDMTNGAELSYIDFVDKIHTWGIGDGHLIESGVLEVPIIVQMSSERIMAHPPIELRSQNVKDTAPFSFTWQGKTWEYIFKSEGDAKGRKNYTYVLHSDSGDDFTSYANRNDLAALSWGWTEAFIDPQTDGFFSTVRDQDLFNPESCTIVAADGIHPSDPESEFHTIYPLTNQMGGKGLEDFKFSFRPSHPIAVPVVIERLLGTKEAQRSSMDWDAFFNVFLPERAEEARLAQKEGRRLKISIVSLPVPTLLEGLRTTLKGYEEEGILYDMQLMVVVTTPNYAKAQVADIGEEFDFGDNYIEEGSAIVAATDQQIQSEPIIYDKDLTGLKCVYVVTSSSKERGIVPGELSAGRQLEWPEAVPAITVLPVLKKIDTSFEVEWMAKEVIGNGASWAGWQVVLVFGVLTSLLSRNGEVPTVKELESCIQKIFPTQEKNRNGTSYQVGTFNQAEFEKLVNGTHVTSLPWISLDSGISFD